MNIAVCISPVLYGAVAHLEARTSRVIEIGGSVYVPSPGDEAAVELAVRLREESDGVHILAVEIGPPETEQALRE